MKTGRKKSKRNSDKMKQRNVYKIARFQLKVLINYVLHSEVLYVTVCTRVETETDWTVVKGQQRCTVT